MSIRSISINTLRTSTVSSPRRWQRQPMQSASSRQANQIQAIRKLEHIYFLERRGLL